MGKEMDGREGQKIKGHEKEKKSDVIVPLLI